MNASAARREPWSPVPTLVLDEYVVVQAPRPVTPHAIKTLHADRVVIVHTSALGKYADRFPSLAAAQLRCDMLNNA